MTTSTQNHLAFVDNLRWVMIVLVVSMHAAVTYSHMGSWYFMEDPKPENRGTLLFFGYYQMGLQAFFMGLLFLIAGYFVPGAYDRKGRGRFLRVAFFLSWSGPHGQVDLSFGQRLHSTRSDGRFQICAWLAFLRSTISLHRPAESYT